MGNSSSLSLSPSRHTDTPSTPPYRHTNTPSTPPRPPKPFHLRRQRLVSLPSDVNEISLPNDDISDEDDTCNYQMVNALDIASPQMPLNELINEFCSEFPVCFAVSESLYGICENRSLMKGQQLSIHFQKDADAVSVKSNSGMEYIVPLITSFGCSVLYNPENKIHTAKKGYTFNETVDLMNANPLPVMVCVTKAFKDMNNIAVEEGEILFLDKIRECKDSTKFLICTNVLSGKTRHIGELCETSFTTDTEKIKLSLLKLMEYVSLPVDVVFHEPSDGSVKLPLYATVDYYTITDQHVEKSVIASTEYSNVSSTSVSKEIIEIMLSLPLEVELVRLAPCDTTKLRSETQELFEHFHPGQVDKVICDMFSSTNYIQTALFKAVNLEGNWRVGVKLHPPKPPDLSTDSDEYEDMDFLPVSKTNHTAPMHPYPPTASLPVQHSFPSYFSHLSSSSGVSPTMHIKSRTDSTIPISSSFPSKPNMHSSYDETEKEKQKSHSPKIVPYLVSRQTASGKVVVEKPYDYVKFSNNRDLLELNVHKLKKQVLDLQKDNTELQDKLQCKGK